MSDDGQMPLTHELLEQSQVDRLKEKLRNGQANECAYCAQLRAERDEARAYQRTAEEEGAQWHDALTQARADLDGAVKALEPFTDVYAAARAIVAKHQEPK